MFEVNLFRHVAVTQAVLPALICSTGRVVNISSVGGKVAMASYRPYAGTKFALEAVSDSLPRELASLGTQVVVVELANDPDDRIRDAGVTGHRNPRHPRPFGLRRR